MSFSKVRDLTGDYSADAVPGKILRAPRLLELGAAEDFFARDYLALIASTLPSVDRELRQAVIQYALDQVRHGAFSWGEFAFNRSALALRNLPKLLLWSLRIEHPKVSEADVEAILSGPDGMTVAGAVWELWGYRPTSEASTQKKTPPSTGEPSSGDSPPPSPPAATDSATTPSPASPSPSSSTPSAPTATS